MTTIQIALLKILIDYYESMKAIDASTEDVVAREGKKSTQLTMTSNDIEKLFDATKD